MYATRNHTEWFRYRGALAGAISGMSLFVVPRSRGLRSGIVIFTAARAGELYVRFLARRGWFDALPSAVARNSDAAAMMMFSGHVIWAWLYHPYSLEPSYKRFLQQYSTLTPDAVKAIADVNAGIPVPDAASKMGLPTTLAALVQLFLRGFRKSLPLYAPIFAVPAIVLGWKRFLRTPGKTLIHVMKGATRSSVFLGAYVAIGIGIIPQLRKLPLPLGKWLIWIAGALGGMTVLIEKKSRRLELALFMATKFLGSIVKIARKRGIAVKNADVAAFCASMAIVMHAFVRHPSYVRPTYHSILTRFFDSDARHKFI